VTAMSTSAAGAALGMAALATASVGLWTLRVALAARGRKVAGAAVAAVEALVFAVAFTRLDLAAPERVGGYALGVAFGTLLGLVLDERLSGGQSELRVVVPGVQPCLVRTLRSGGWPATSLTGEGADGPVTLLFVAADDSRLPALLEDVRQAFPAASWTVHRQVRERPGGGRRRWFKPDGTPTGLPSHSAPDSGRPESLQCVP
jgi:uncharacterized protein YebE (UPF0316 family)